MSDSELPWQPTGLVGERAKETERERIAKDLHDELGSRLTAIKMALAQLAQHLPSRSPVLQEQVRYADQLVDDAIGSMLDIIDDLHPAVLDLGLIAALEWLATRYTRQTGIPHRLLNQSDLPATLLDSFQTVSLYRIACEALHNASRHARAHNIRLSLRHASEVLTMEIIDDGIGLAATANKQANKQIKSSGIRGMQRRAAAIGASLTLQTSDRGGVKLSVSLPASSDRITNLKQTPH